MYLKIFTILVFLTGFSNLSAQDFILAPNGVTCLCPTASVGDTGDVNGITYTKRTREDITDVNADTTCTSDITDMSELFWGHTDFNGDISSWDTSSVVNMEFTLADTQVFNQNIGFWDVSSVTNMKALFAGASLFNQDISSWDTSSVVNMEGLFAVASVFNQDINSWDVGNVTNMTNMFTMASLFNQDIEIWQFNSNVEFDSFVSNSGLDINNYNSLLNAFSTQNLTNKTLNSDNLTYCNITAWEDLVNNKGWTISGDTYSQTIIEAPNNVGVAPDSGTCIATNVDLGTPTITNACGTTTVTNDAPSEYQIGDTDIIWTVVDENGVESTDLQTVSVIIDVDIAELCYVSSDDIEVTKNRVFLFNIDGLNVDNYEVLRETTTGGVYETIGFIVPPANSFLDNTSNNSTQAYRYKVQTLDICGTLSEESPYHKTILLQSSIAANNTINLSWTPYVGTDYTTYNIFKQINGGTFELFTSIASTNLTYNDIEVDLSINSYAYYVSIDVAGCIGTPFMSEAIRSNQDGTMILDVVDVEQLKKSIILFPNPSSSIVNVSVPNDVMFNKVSVINNIGQVVAKYNTKTFNVESLIGGIYYITIETDKGVFTKRLIKR